MRVSMRIAARNQHTCFRSWRKIVLVGGGARRGMLVGFISRFVRHFFVLRSRTRRKSLRLHNDSREIFSYYAFTHEIAYFLQKRYLSEREREKDSEGERERRERSARNFW